MCYSAQIKADYGRFVREYGAVLSIKDFFDLFWRRLTDPTIVVPRAVESAFASPETDEAREIRRMIAQHAAAHVEDLRLKQAAQRERLAAAEAKLAKKTTKTASDERRIALAGLRRSRSASTASNVPSSTRRIRASSQTAMCR